MCGFVIKAMIICSSQMGVGFRTRAGIVKAFGSKER